MAFSPKIQQIDSNQYQSLSSIPSSINHSSQLYDQEIKRNAKNHKENYNYLENDFDLIKGPSQKSNRFKETQQYRTLDNQSSRINKQVDLYMTQTMNTDLQQYCQVDSPRSNKNSTNYNKFKSFYSNNKSNASSKKRKIPEFEYSAEKSLRHTEQMICRTFSQVSIPKANATFSDRMDFDTYKRQQRQKKVEVLRYSDQKRITSIERDALYQRLLQDTDRRNQMKVAREQMKEQQISARQRSAKKSITEKESEQLYQRLMSHERAKKQRIENQKRIKEIEKEIEMINQKKYAKPHQKMNKNQEGELVNKMMQDTARRRQQQQRILMIKDLVESLANVETKKNVKQLKNQSQKIQQSTINSKEQTEAESIDSNLVADFIINEDSQNSNRVEIQVYKQPELKEILQTQDINALDVWKELMKNGKSGGMKVSFKSAQSMKTSEFPDCSEFAGLKPNDFDQRISDQFSNEGYEEISKIQSSLNSKLINNKSEHGLKKQSLSKVQQQMNQEHQAKGKERYSLNVNNKLSLLHSTLEASHIKGVTIKDSSRNFIDEKKHSAQTQNSQKANNNTRVSSIFYDE